VAGIVLMMIGLVMTFVQVEPGPGFMPTLPGTWDMLAEGVLTMFVALALSAVGLYFLTKHFGHLPLFSRLVLSDGLSAGAATSDSPSSPPTATELGVHIGDTGTVTAMLRPVGRAMIGDKLVDVVSDGQWIEPDKTIRVVSVQGNRIVVEEA
jgi:membrane-bound serine protease (ClpP class)